MCNVDLLTVLSDNRNMMGEEKSKARYTCQSKTYPKKRAIKL